MSGSGVMSADRHPGNHSRPRFYAGMATAIAIVVLVGFAPTYYLRAGFLTEPLPLYLHVHGFVLSAWILLLVAQAALVTARRTDVHRKLGVAGAGLAVLVAVAGVTAGILSGRRDVAAGFGDAAREFLTVPLFSMAVFTALASAAIVWRRQAQTHKRLMLLATINLLDAPLARWPGAPEIPGVYILVDLFIGAGVVHDLASGRRVDPAYVWGGALIIAGQILRGAVGRSEPWHSFARGLIG
jgi:hypothetical protein